MTIAHIKTTILLFCLLDCLTTAYSQAQTITLHKQNASLPEIFAEIRNQAGYYFYYDAEAMTKAHPVTINVEQATIETVLPICFKDQPLEYTLREKIIAVREKQVPDKPVSAAVFGKIVDAVGSPLAGASISSHGQTTESDGGGNFQFDIADTKAVLRISHVGYETQEFSLAGRREVLVKMTLSASKLDEVQVIAYGTTTKRLSTGDVTVVSAATIAQQPVSNPLAALEGRVPGLFITQSNGVPGGALSVQIRGKNSIQNGNNPLYIIDGVPVSGTSLSSPVLSGLITGGGNPLSSINPDQIESISILKDADATSIYGSRGANGVILITTKHGKSERTTLDINANTGISDITRHMNLLATPQYLQMRHEAFANDGMSPGASDYDLLQWDTTRYTNWEKELIGNTAHQTDFHATLTGGNSNTQFVLGGNYRRESTVFGHGFNDQKASGYLNLHHISANQKLVIQLSINYGIENNHLPTGDLTSQVFRLAPNAPAIFDSLGNLNWAGGSFNNPFGIFKRQYLAKTENIIGGMVIEYHLLSGLNLKANTGFTSMHVDESTAYPLSSLNPAYGYQSGFNYFSAQSLQTWIIEPQLTYSIKRSWGKLDALIGATFQNSLNKGQVLLADGFTSDELLQDIGNAASITQQGTNYAQYRYNALFGRLTYNLNDKYLVNLTARHDGSSRFGPGRQFNNFGAVGAAWVFSRTKGFENMLPWISFGKWRASYGVTGNDQIGDYQYIPTWASAFYPYGSASGIIPVNLSDPSYSWEVNKKWETGLDLSFFKEKITFSVSYFQNHSGNQLIYQPVPGITGFTGIQVNLPATVRNTGWEFSMTSNNITSKNFSWSSTANLTVPHNQLTNFPGLASSPYVYIYRVGQPLSIYQSFHYTGVDPQTGVYTFSDVDHDGMISYPNDLETKRSIKQEYYGGLENDMHWKGLQLNFFLQFVKQTGRNYTYYYPGVPGSAINQPDQVLARWQSEGQQTGVQQFTQSYASKAYQAFNNYRQSDNTISDASFIRLKTVGLSYTFPSKARFSRSTQMKIYVQGQNLLTISHFQGMDPENQTINALPPLRVFVAGMQIIL